MQFIETNSFNVRSAIYTFASKDSSTLVTLFPLVHIASPEFYAAVRSRLSQCSTVLLEGLDSNAPGVIALVLSYMLCDFKESHGLVHQSTEYLLGDFEGTVLQGDVPGEAFDEEWAVLPLRLRLMIFFVALYAGLRCRFSRPSTRELARGLEINDLPSRREIFQSPSGEAMNGVILDFRDQHVVRVLADFLQAHVDAEEHLAVVFGAAHMPRIAGFLLNQTSYRIKTSEWFTVFDHEDV